MRRVVARDVSALPTWGYSSQSGPWWGALGFMAIEGMAFALAVGAYLYLYAANPRWPLNSPPPDLVFGTAQVVLLVASVVPNALANRAAYAQDLLRARIWLVVISAVGVVSLVLRGFEFARLNVRWDTDAYGSAVWFILGLHTTHIATDLGDTLVLAVLMFTRHAQPRRFSDITDNAFYWNFVVLAWLPLYALIYWTPRL